MTVLTAQTSLRSYVDRSNLNMKRLIPLLTTDELLAGQASS